MCLCCVVPLTAGLAGTPVLATNSAAAPWADLTIHNLAITFHEFVVTTNTVRAAVSEAVLALRAIERGLLTGGNHALRLESPPEADEVAASRERALDSPRDLEHIGVPWLAMSGPINCSSFLALPDFVIDLVILG